MAANGRRYRQNKHPFMRIYLALCLVVVLFPILILFIWCFAGSWWYPDLLPGEWSLRAVESAFEMKPDLAQIVFSSIGISMAVALLSTALSFFVARAIALYDFKGKYLVDFLVLVPLCISATALAMGMHVFFLRIGLANTVPGVILVHLVIVMPYSIKLLSNPLRLIGRGLSEQAQNLGASAMRSFFTVEIAPMIPSIIASVNLSFIVSFGQYFLTFIIGGGRVTTLALVMAPWITAPDRAVAAVYAAIYLVVTLLVFLVIDVFEKVVSKHRKNYLV